MSDHSNDPETPMERALRMKKAALATKPKPPGSGNSQRISAAGVAPGISKPALRK